jgi:hypothetical protein
VRVLRRANRIADKAIADPRQLVEVDFFAPVAREVCGDLFYILNALASLVCSSARWAAARDVISCPQVT